MEDLQKYPIGYAMKLVNNQIRRNLDLRFAEAGFEEVSAMQGPMLGFITEKSAQGDVYQKDIEKRFNIRRSTATVALQNMEQKGLLVREAVEGDGRLKRIVLTPKARHMDEEIHQMIDVFHADMEKGISPKEKEEFLRILTIVQNNLEQSGKEIERNRGKKND